MGRRTINQKRYLSVAQVFHWATKEHYTLWFTGKLERHRRTESILPRLVRDGRLKVHRYGKKNVYSCLRTTKGKDYAGKIEHGLGCTECLVRAVVSRPDCTVIPEKKFRGLGVIPEWGIKYNNKTLLLLEFCTRDNFYRTSIRRGKLYKYNRYSDKIEEKFDGKVIVLFVVDICKDGLERFMQREVPLGEMFFFVDYATFQAVPLGEQLKSEIYLWGEDGKPYSLTDVQS